MSKHITEKQKKLLEFIYQYQKEHNVIPTLVEMGHYMGVSISSVQQKITSLTRKKFIERQNIYIIK